MEGSWFFAELQQIVTAENVNRIPKGWRPSRYNQHKLHQLREMKRERRGFLFLLIWPEWPEEFACLPWFLRTWGHCIKWNKLSRWDNENKGDKYTFLEWHFLANPILALTGFQLGCPCGPIFFQQFCRFSRRKNIEPRDDMLPKFVLLLDWLIRNGHADPNWTEGPQWVNDICSTYRTRRSNCQAAARLLCGMNRVFPLLYRSRDVARLIAAHIWATRWDEAWDARE